MRFKAAAISLCMIFAAALMLSACASTGKTGNAGTAGQGTGTTTGGPIPGSQEDLVVNVGDRVFFDYNEYTLKDEGRATLQRQAAWLKQHPAVTVQIEGHCDERGTREYNLALGSRRATAAKDYLVSLGVAEARLSTISYGKERPVCVESTESCYSINRRAVTVVTKTGAGS